MKTKEQLVEEIKELIFENNLPQNGSSEIIAYRDEDVEVDFVEIGFGGLQKDSIVWERLDEDFDTEEFVDNIFYNI